MKTENKHYPDFKKMIVYIVNYKEQVCNDLAFLQYFFTGSTHAIKPQQHGNAKHKSQTYCKIKPSVIKKANNHSSNPTRSVASNVKDLGGVKKIQNPADVLNTEQLRDFKYRKDPKSAISTKGTDELSTLIDMAKNDMGHFVCEVKQFPEPLIVLATDQQLIDLERFCTDSNEYWPMSVDPTFKLGKFNVTPITFRNLTLSTNAYSYQSPIVMGPVLIHYSKTEPIYTTFFQTLLRLRPGISCLKAYGTDGEQALVNALHNVFPQAVSLRCFKHLETNAKLKIAELKLNKNENTFLEDIFHGKEALLHSDDEEAFDRRLDSLVSSWKILDPSEKFVKYIQSLESVMKYSMISSVRRQAGLGSPPILFYTNDCESNNFQLKHWLGFREKKPP